VRGAVTQISFLSHHVNICRHLIRIPLAPNKSFKSCIDSIAHSDVCCRIVGSKNILGAHLGMGRCSSSSLLLEITSSSCGLLLDNSSLTTSRRSKRRFSQQHTVAAAPRGLLSITESSNTGRISSSPWLRFSQCSTSLPGRLHCCLPTRKSRIVVSAFQAEEDLGFQTEEEELLLQSKKVGNLFRVFHAVANRLKISSLDACQSC
jgi:hypothetical protein